MKSIPEAGDPFLGGRHVQRVAVVRMYAGTNTSDGDSDDVAVTSFADSAASQVKALFSVPAGTLVHDLWWEAITSWCADSNALEITVGDTSASAYLTDTVFKPDATGNAGTIYGKCSALSMTYSNGKRYTAADTISATIIANSGPDATQAGHTIFYLLYSV